MKKTIYIILFIGIFVLLLVSGLFWKQSGVSSVTLNVEAPEVDVVVTDSNNNMIALNGGVLTVGEEYTVIMTPIDVNKGISKFVFNGINRISEVNNNVFQFICVQNVKIKIESSLICDLTISNYKYGNFFAYVSPDGSFLNREMAVWLNNDNELTYYSWFSYPNSWFISFAGGLQNPNEFFDVYINDEKYSITAYSEVFDPVFNYEIFLTMQIETPISIRFEYPPTSLTTTGDNCTISVLNSNNQSVNSLNYGETYTLSVVADSGYQIDSIILNGQIVQNNSFFTATQISIINVSTSFITTRTLTVSNLPLLSTVIINQNNNPVSVFYETATVYGGVSTDELILAEYDPKTSFEYGDKCIVNVYFDKEYYGLDDVSVYINDVLVTNFILPWRVNELYNVSCSFEIEFCEDIEIRVDTPLSFCNMSVKSYLDSVYMNPLSGGAVLVDTNKYFYDYLVIGETYQIKSSCPSGKVLESIMLNGDIVEDNSTFIASEDITLVFNYKTAS